MPFSTGDVSQQLRFSLSLYFSQGASLSATLADCTSTFRRSPGQGSRCPKHFQVM